MDETNVPAPRTNHTDPAARPGDPMEHASTEKEQLQPHLTCLPLGMHLGHGHRVEDPGLQTSKRARCCQPRAWVAAVLPEGLGHRLPREPTLVPAPSPMAVGSAHAPAVPGAHTACRYCRQRLTPAVDTQGHQGLASSACQLHEASVPTAMPGYGLDFVLPK